MKKLLYALSIGLISTAAIAQNDNTNDHWTNVGNDVVTGSSFVGKVGINTITPNYNLHLHSNIDIGNDTKVNTFQMTNNSTGTGGLNGLTLSLFNNNSSISSMDGTLFIQAKGRLAFGGDINKEHVYILQDGKVGIGISNPSASLEVYNGDFILGGPYKKFIFHTQSWSPSANELIIAPQNNGAFDWSKALILKDDGRLEVNGRTDIYGRLDVYDEVYATEITVQLPPFPDYVFEEEYELTSLDELELYIEENGHLPNIPSAEEVNEEGIGVGKLIHLQMEKIEELTLYILELKKDIEDLETQIKE